MNRYRTSQWQRIREEDHELDPEFAKHLREIARPRQIAYQRLMEAYDGNPVGVECRKENSESWAFVLPDVAGECPWRIQHFDADGFSGHNCHETLQKAIEALIGDGYIVIDQGALDRCATTQRWATGVRREQIRLQFNMGRISWQEMLERMNAITQQAQGAAA